MLRRLVDALRRHARRLLLASIRGYQRHLSPHKGFACAYRVHTGRGSCSALGARAVRRHGVRGGLVLLRRRTRRCGEVHRRAHRPRAAQRGDCDCDLPVDLPCDGPPRGGAGGCRALRACDACDACAGCDLPRREREPRRSRRARDVDPRRGRSSSV